MVNTKNLLESCEQLQQSFNCLLLSTVNEYAQPLASFAPYVEEQGSFYIFVSELAQHTQNMTKQPVASVMFIESEESARNLYARQRAIIQVSVHLVVETQLKEKLFAKMELTHGKTINLLRGLTDFKMLELRPEQGRYVAGFGKAYDWDIKEKSLTHVTEAVLNKKQ
ncbi:MAG: putative heme iron utilization protein [Oceanospirillaceae bacterium]|jgi:putative heme iron utilization protein